MQWKLAEAQASRRCLLQGHSEGQTSSLDGGDDDEDEDEDAAVAGAPDCEPQQETENKTSIS